MRQAQTQSVLGAFPYRRVSGAVPLAIKLPFIFGAIGAFMGKGTAMRAIVCFALLATLAACGSNQSRVNNASAADDAKCKSFGAFPPSDKYYHCRMTLDRDRAAADAAGEALARQGSYSTMMAVGAGMMNGR